MGIRSRHFTFDPIRKNWLRLDCKYGHRFYHPGEKIRGIYFKEAGAKKILSLLLTMFIIVFINVIGISICVVLKNAGFNRRFFDVWTSLLPALLNVSYIAAMLWYPVTNGIVGAVFKKKSR